MNIRLDKLLFALSTSLDYVEEEFLGSTTNHGKRVALLTLHLCRALGMSEAEVFDAACCAILHDNALTLGNLNRNPMLESQGLSAVERLKEHARLGEENIRDFPFLTSARNLVYLHHENWDGSGYHGVSGADIPLAACVIHLADIMDVELRLGRGSPDAADGARRHVLRGRGAAYAPVVADAMLDILNDALLHELLDGRIDESLAMCAPRVTTALTTQDVLLVCRIFALIIDAKSHFTQTHSRDIAAKAGRLAEYYCIAPAHRERLMIAAYLHDIGKMAVPLSILEKPGSLDKAEFDVMKDHAAKGWEILKSVQGFGEIALWGGAHHEKLNGTGYSKGLSAPDLPFECRLLACCDIYQALTEDRPYRSGMDHKTAMGILSEMASSGCVDAEITECINDMFAS
jgi:putative nucleotidyltransferase with HDIG domain